MANSPKQKQTKQPDLSIVIPAYCEEKRIGKTLDELSGFLNSNKLFRNKNVEVIVVAADAPDTTHKLVASKKKFFGDYTLLKPGERVGKGRDVQYGMLRANGKTVMYMDADLATPLHHINELYLLCANDSDIVIGTRNLLTFRTSRFRNYFAYAGNAVYRLASGIKVEDTQCGFKMFRADACKLCFSKLTIMGWGFDIELLAIAKANDLSVKTIRIDDWDDKPFSTYNEGALRITTRMIKDFVNINRLKKSGYYHKKRRRNDEKFG